jgi:Subtilase family
MAAVVHASNLTLVAFLLASFACPATAQEADETKAGKAIADAESAKPTQFFWQSEVLNKDKVQTELAELYVTLHANGILKTKPAPIEKGDTPTDVMIRAGAWPRWLERGMPSNVDAMLCELNRDICRQSDSKGGPVSDWSQAWPGRTINLPDVALNFTYQIGNRNWHEFTSQVSGVDVVETKDYAELWCRKPRGANEICTKQGIEGGWPDEQPSIYTYAYDGGEIPGEYSGIASKSALQRFGAEDSPSKMVAIPVIDATIETKDSPDSSVHRATRSLSERILVDQKLQLEASVENERPFRRMRFLGDAGKLFNPFSDGDTLSPLRIAHIDAPADLSHCRFGPGVKFMRWNFDTEMFDSVDPEAVASVGAAPGGGVSDAGRAAPACGAVNDHPLREKSHGTHTLGLLVDLLTLDGTLPEPASGADPPIKIYHVPASLDSLNEQSMKPILAMLNQLPNFGITVVNMSASWNKAETKPIEVAISRQKDNLLYVVAAGNQDEDSGCSVIPACIESKNVVSVIGLDMDDQQQLSILDHSNRGANHHEIGAIGADIVSTVDGNMVGKFSGTSQATPLVSAVVGHMMRRRHMGIEEVYERIMTTGMLDGKLLSASKATMIDMQQAMDFEADMLALKDGCKMRGKFDDFVQDGSTTVTISATDKDTDGHFDVAPDDLRRVFYNENDDWHLFMYSRNGDFTRRAFQVDARHLDRLFRYKPFSLQNCPGRAEGQITKVKLDDVKDLILSSR